MNLTQHSLERPGILRGQPQPPHPAPQLARLRLTIRGKNESAHSDSGNLFPDADRGWAAAIGMGGYFTMWNHKLGIVVVVAGSTQDGPGHPGVPNILEANLKQ